MHQRNRYNLFLALLCFPFLLFGEWQVALHHIQESKEALWNQLVELAQTEDRSSADKSVELISSSGRTLPVSQSFARKLLSIDSFGHLNRSDESCRGHHPVIRLNNLYFKSDVCLPPLDPMLETAVFFFHTLLFHEGVVPSDFVFVRNVQIHHLPIGPWDSNAIEAIVREREESYLIDNPSVRPFLVLENQNHLLQLSQAIDGERGNTFFTAVDSGTRSLDEIESLDFQKHVISDLLFNPGDHKTENFIVTPHFPKKHLINIDNDGMLYHTHVERNERQQLVELQPFGGCKNILFLLKPLMNQPIDPQLKQVIVDMNVEEFLHLWLSLLTRCNREIETLFQTIPSFIKQYNRNFLPFKINEHTILRIRTELHRIQEYFTTHPTCTSEDLFSFLKPELSEYYSWMLQQHATYMKSLSKLYGNERPLAQGRTPNARIGIKPLKSMWIFQALQRYKTRRNTSLEQAALELSTAFPEAPFLDTLPLPIPSDIREILLKNSDDPLWREWISNDIIEAFFSERLPETMKEVYPYSFLEKEVRLLQQNEPTKARDILIHDLKNFTLSQKTYEDFVSFLFENKIDPSALPQGIRQCMESIQYQEVAVCK